MDALTSTFHCPFPAPSPHAQSSEALQHVETSELKKGGDTAVLSQTFYADTPALKWSPAALDSPMGTSIPNPKRS